MKKAICTGSFDPVTNGHINIFERAAKLVDELIICVFLNPNKKYLFSMDERAELLREATVHIDNLTVDTFEGLAADYIKQHDINVIIRGLRSATDFEYEVNKAQMMRHLIPTVDTIFLLTAPEFLFISSSGVRELAHFGGDVHGLVPECVEFALQSKMKI
ncbi:MAG: pantetheine-phosphate adenylyltransferase [Selenomonadaceae bacterium]|nr:pantetheine-phosphate adenylyltransferase [Selenomonadaceae bacterium]